MRTTTTNRRAFESVTHALRRLELFRESKDRRLLADADAKLDAACREDPDYSTAWFYSAAVKDLQGQPKDACLGFQRLLDEIPESPEFLARREEIQYNLAVSFYHRYSRRHLERATKEFMDLIDRSRNPATICMAHAGLAQTFAMREIPPMPDQADTGEIEHFYNESGRFAEQALEELESQALQAQAQPARDAIRGAIHNARGMAAMYYFDYFPDRGLVEQALSELGRADEYIPMDWANYCDMGSAYFRMGTCRQRTEDFEKARAYLQEVLDRLRPNYGFALYEMGRTYRVEGRFTEALEYFARAREIPVDYREVGDSRLNLETDRAKSQQRIYP